MQLRTARILQFRLISKRPDRISVQFYLGTFTEVPDWTLTGSLFLNLPKFYFSRKLCVLVHYIIRRLDLRSA